MSARPKLLLIAHSYYNRAGVEEHLRTLSKSLAQQYDIHIAFPHQGQIVLLHEAREVQRYPAENISFFSPLRAPQCEQALSAILTKVQPEVIHLVHFLGWPLAIFDLLKQSQLPLISSQHDYFAITPFYTMQNQSPEETLTKEYSLKYFGQDHSDYLQKRRAYLSQAFKIFKTRITASAYLANTLNGIFPGDYKIIPYGIEAFQVMPTPAAERLRFGYIGSLLPQKGWDVLYAAFAKLTQQGKAAELHFFGGNKPENLPVHPNIFFHGVYEQDQLPKILSTFDIGIVPSVFAETYSIVLSELWQAKKPVAVSDIGALGERVEDYKNGRKFKPGDALGLEQVLRWFMEDQSWRSWPTPQPVYAAEMAMEYAQVYQRALQSVPA